MREAAEAIVTETPSEASGQEKKAKQKERDQLVAQYLPFATYIVRKVSKSISGSVDFEDLLSYAKIGLIEAAERFDSRYKVDFRTFAFYRIRGAIYDGLRTTGWLSRTQFQKHQFEEASNHYLRSVSDQVAAGKAVFEDPRSEIESTILNLASVYIMSLDAAEGIQVRDESQEPVDVKFEMGKTKVRIQEAIEKLPEKEKQLIKLYYYGGMTLDEAGVSLGLSRSWTSRLHARALELLQELIRESTPADEQPVKKNGQTRPSSQTKEIATPARKKSPVKDKPRDAGAHSTRC